MPEISDAQNLLAALGMPPAQHNEMAALTLLALCGLKPHDQWQSAQRHSTTISNGIMAFIREQDMLRDCPAGKVFVTAFPTFAEFRKHMRHIAWETEVWIAEAPEHLIHFNGDRFLGPRP